MARLIRGRLDAGAVASFRRSRRRCQPHSARRRKPTRRSAAARAPALVTVDRKCAGTGARPCALLTFGDRLLPARVGVDPLGLVPNCRGRTAGSRRQSPGARLSGKFAGQCTMATCTRNPTSCGGRAAKRSRVGRSRESCHRRSTVRPSPPSPPESVQPRSSRQVRLNPSQNCIWNVPRPYTTIAPSP